MSEPLLDRLKRFRVRNKIRKHKRRDARYQDIYNKHEEIKSETVDRIESGEISSEDQLKSINKKLKRMRDRMSRIEKRDTKSAIKSQDLLNRIG
tara:strand:+ start:221 stop:502 length:282 start_codon:yes stop_codon:yes gene_type:complete